MVLPGVSDITTESTGDAANSRRCWSVTPQQGGRSDITVPERKEGSKEVRKEVRGGWKEKGGAMRPGRLTFDSTHRKYSVESASAWMPSSPCHLSVSVFVFLGDRAVCHKERGVGWGWSSLLLPAYHRISIKGQLFISLTKKHKNRFVHIYCFIHTFFFTIVNHKSIEK